MTVTADFACAATYTRIFAAVSSLFSRCSAAVFPLLSPLFFRCYFSRSPRFSSVFAVNIVRSASMEQLIREILLRCICGKPVAVG
jgi:hypothetical protein